MGTKEIVILCTVGTDCDKYFKRSLFLVGEIGGNDYNYPFFVGGNITQLKAMVPLVVGAVSSATSVSYSLILFMMNCFKQCEARSNSDLSYNLKNN